MSIFLKRNDIKVKNPTTGEYEGQSLFTDGSTTEQIQEITQAGTAQVAAINNKGQETLASIPDDYTELSGSVSNLKSEIDDIKDAYGVNLFNPCDLIPNTFLNATTGEEEDSKWYSATDYIEVDGTYTIRPFEYSGDARIRIYLYDANKSFDSRNVVNPANYPRGFTFTWSGYVRVNIDNGGDAYENPYMYMLVSGYNTDNVAVTFVPYYTAYDRTAREIIKKGLYNYGLDYSFTNLDDISGNSIYYISPSIVTSNYPPINTACYVQTIVLGERNKMQIAYNARGNSFCIRAQVNEVWSDWYDYESRNQVDYETSTVALFPTVGCCGDSFTAGYLYNKVDSEWYDPNYVPNGEYYMTSYPAVMGRLYGISVSAYAKGGLTSGGWRTDTKGLPALLADAPKSLYVIALGLNDRTQQVPLGVEEDIDTEPETQTYLGNMGAIIRAIHSHAPLAKIILCKSLWVYGAGGSSANIYYTYISQGVELLSRHLGIPYIETLNDQYFCSDAYVNGLKGLHPTAPLYAGIGKRMGELIGKCVIDNPDYFYNFYVPNN